MKLALHTLLMSSLIALVVGCGTNAEPESDAVAKIRAMEDSLFTQGAFDQRKAQALIDVYKAYANVHPADTLSPEYLFRAANVAKSMHDGTQCLGLYDRIITEFPNWNKLSDVFYLRAFTLDSELKDIAAARIAYEEVIQRYPDHAFAKDARSMIENLGLTDEELIRRFQLMQADSAANGDEPI